VARKSDESASSAEAVSASIREGKFSPLYLWYGEEDFLIDELVALLTEHAVDASTRSFNLDVVSGSEADARAVAALVASYPMMGERRVVIVREFDKIANKEQLLGVIEKPVPSTCLACISAKPDFRQKIYKAFQSNAVLVQCKPLYDNEIAGWIAQRVRKLGKKVTPEACQLMQGYVSRSLREIQNEITKLFIYVGDKPEITVDDVNQVVGMSKLWNIYELQRSVGQRDLARSLEISQRMVEAGESPIYNIVMLTKYFQKLLLLPELAAKLRSEQELAGALGVNRFFLGEYAAAAKRYSAGDIERSFAALRDADLSMKTSSPDPNAVMTALLYALVAPAARMEAAS
jgi:DNA polymerase-3 subunit delta